MGKLNVKPRTIFWRDNLDILKGINDSCIDLIYLDPPFNKKKTFVAALGSSAEGAEFSDIFKEEDIKDEWVKSIEQDNHELYSLLKGIKEFSNRYNYCYSVYMAIRLKEVYRVLKETGSVYLHCDPTMSHYLKIIMDCIFDEKSFRNEIVWCYKENEAATAHFPRKHDIILFYTKSKTKNYAFNIQRGEITEAQSKRYNHEIDGEKYAMMKGKMRKLSGGARLRDWWELPIVQKAERYGYPTQKPLALLEIIIKASSNKGDIVLDPFCGCATTCVAAEKLGRKWIGIDVSYKAYDLVKERLVKEVPTDLFRGEPNFEREPPQRSGTVDQAKKHVYVISHPKYPNEYKVGVAINTDSRLRSYQTGDPDRAYALEFSKETQYFNEIEHAIHAEFDNKHEWVKADLDEIIKRIKTWKPSPSKDTRHVADPHSDYKAGVSITTDKTYDLELTHQNHTPREKTTYIHALFINHPNHPS